MSLFSVVVNYLRAQRHVCSTTFSRRLWSGRGLLQVVLLALCLPLLFWRADAYCDTPDAILAAAAAALVRLDATNLDDDWSFAMELREADELLVIHSDPQRDKYERRQLLTVNGETPDRQRQQTFLESERKRIDELDPEATGYRHLVDAQTMQLTEHSGGYARLTFIPRIKAMEKSRDQMRGSLRLNLGTGRIEEIEIHNEGQLSPAFSVTVDSYRLMLKFQQEQGENLLRKLESRAVGTAGFLKGFDVLVDATFSGYKRAHP